MTSRKEKRESEKFAFEDYEYEEGKQINTTLVDALKKTRFEEFNKTQTECIEPLLQKNDLLVYARTGSGKTLSMAVPIFHKILENMDSIKTTNIDGNNIDCASLLDLRDVNSIDNYIIIEKKNEDEKYRFRQPREISDFVLSDFFLHSYLGQPVNGKILEKMQDGYLIEIYLPKIEKKMKVFYKEEELKPQTQKDALCSVILDGETVRIEEVDLMKAKALTMNCDDMDEVAESDRQNAFQSITCHDFLDNKSIIFDGKIFKEGQGGYLIEILLPVFLKKMKVFCQLDGRVPFCQQCQITVNFKIEGDLKNHVQKFGDEAYLKATDFFPIKVQNEEFFLRLLGQPQEKKKQPLAVLVTPDADLCRQLYDVFRYIRDKIDKKITINGETIDYRQCISIQCPDVEVQNQLEKDEDYKRITDVDIISEEDMKIISNLRYKAAQKIWKEIENNKVYDSVLKTDLLKGEDNPSLANEWKRDAFKAETPLIFIGTEERVFEYFYSKKQPESYLQNQKIPLYDASEVQYFFIDEIVKSFEANKSLKTRKIVMNIGYQHYCDYSKWGLFGSNPQPTPDEPNRPELARCMYQKLVAWFQGGQQSEEIDRIVTEDLGVSKDQIKNLPFEGRSTLTENEYRIKDLQKLEKITSSQNRNGESKKELEETIVRLIEKAQRFQWENELKGLEKDDTRGWLDLLLDYYTNRDNQKNPFCKRHCTVGFFSGRYSSDCTEYLSEKLKPEETARSEVDETAGEKKKVPLWSDEENRERELNVSNFMLKHQTEDFYIIQPKKYEKYRNPETQRNYYGGTIPCLFEDSIFLLCQMCGINKEEGRFFNQQCKIIVFFESQEQVLLAMKYILEKKRRAADEGQKIVENFFADFTADLEKIKKGEAHILISSKKYKNGLDLDNIKLVIIAFPTTIEDYDQMAGRVERFDNTGLVISLRSMEDIKQRGRIYRPDGNKIIPTNMVVNTWYRTEDGKSKRIPPRILMRADKLYYEEKAQAECGGNRFQPRSKEDVLNSLLQKTNLDYRVRFDRQYPTTAPRTVKVDKKDEIITHESLDEISRDRFGRPGKIRQLTQILRSGNGDTLYEKLLHFFRERYIEPRSLVNNLLEFELVNKEVTRFENYMITDLLPETQAHLNEFNKLERGISINSRTLDEKLKECNSPEEIIDCLNIYKETVDRTRPLRDNIDTLSRLNDRVKSLLKLQSDAQQQNQTKHTYAGALRNGR